ncbi:hypothetical protein PoB_003232000 [Plakobranchus ocellatus]|uniref:Reverse transcriptase zinc-binding domain-containing protein n=1 Tax=Plakobranchus ocellatus TaxID=259542 RepID=A0AAV4ACB7_9GAST|nr:hypothetical protein PoB_003232000 [Plakobranchus ocellatus]
MAVIVVWSLTGLPRSEAVQIFPARAKHTLLLADRALHGCSATTACRLCEEQEETVKHVLSKCWEVAGDHPSGWPDKPANEILWCGDRNAMSTKSCGCSSAEPCGRRETGLRRLPQKKGRLPPAREAQQRPNRAEMYEINLIATGVDDVLASLRLNDQFLSLEVLNMHGQLNLYASDLIWGVLS